MKALSAAPSYLKRRGVPRTIEDLQDHQAVNYFSSRTGRNVDWDFIVDGVSTEVKVNGVVSVNNADAYLACALQGFGMIQAPRYIVLPYLQSGELIEVMPQMRSSPMPISVAYLHNWHLSPKVRAFVDWVAELFGACPLLSGRGDADGDTECMFAGKPGPHTIRSVLERENQAEHLC